MVSPRHRPVSPPIRRQSLTSLDDLFAQDMLGDDLVSTDLIYDVLRRHEPDNILLQAARADASTGLLDIVRPAGMLARVKGRILHKDLDKISPLAVPIILEVGHEPIHSEGRDAILAEAEADLVREVMGK